MSHGLNGPQAKAVSHGEGPLLVFAGAGSGKTRVLTQRILSLVDKGVEPEKILALTFTNKAAGEMKERLELAVGKKVARAITVSTFHSLCVRILRMYHAQAGRKKGFSIYDDGDVESTLKPILNDEATDSEGKKQDMGVKWWKPDAVAEKIQARKAKLEEVKDFHPEPSDKDSVLLKRVWERYESALSNSNAFDFGDLIFWGTKLSERNDEIGQTLRSSYSYVLVDEFQDTDGVQLRFVRALASSGNICVVGDDDQCIYAWRGAEPENIRKFRTLFPGTTVVKLEQNYRSTKNVIGAAVGVIERVEDREPKRMFTDMGPGESIKLVKCRDEMSEALTILEETKALLAQGVAPGKIAVLYRNHTASKAIEEVFRGAQIAHKTHGGFRWFDRSEIRDALSWFKLITNQSSNVDCLRALGTVQGVGAKSVGKLMERASADNNSIFATLQNPTVTAGIRADQRSSVAEFAKTIRGIGAASETASPQTVVRRILDDSGMVKYYRESAEKCQLQKSQDGAVEKIAYVHLSKEQREKMNDFMEKSDRLEELVNDAARFEERAKNRGESASFTDYVEAICLRADDRENDDKGIQLMTVHASKGLEFDTVFIPSCEDQSFARVKSQAKDDEEDAYAESEEDQRRLFYVAVTRAQNRLYLLHAGYRRSRGIPEPRDLCRFVKDIPPESIHSISAEMLARRAQSIVASCRSAEEDKEWSNYAEANS